MALNTLKGNHLTPLGLKGLNDEARQLRPGLSQGISCNLTTKGRLSTLWVFQQKCAYTLMSKTCKGGFDPNVGLLGLQCAVAIAPADPYCYDYAPRLEIVMTI